MRKFITIAIIAIIATSCYSKSGKREPRTELGELNLKIDELEIKHRADSMKMDSVIKQTIVDMALNYPKSFESRYDTVNGDYSRQYAVLLEDESAYTLFESGVQIITTPHEHVMKNVVNQLRRINANFEIERTIPDSEWFISYSNVIYCPPPKE